MLNLYQGTPKDKLKNFRDSRMISIKIYITYSQKKFKDVDPEIVELAAMLIRKFK